MTAQAKKGKKTASTPVVSGADVVKVTLQYEPSGAMHRIGCYCPQRAALLTDKPAAIVALPEGLKAPLYTVIKIGPREAPMNAWIVLDEPEGEPPRIWVDANGNGDLTDDPPIEWTGDDGHAGCAMLKVPYGTQMRDLQICMYRFNKNDPNCADFKNILFYYRDYGWFGEITLGGKTYKAGLDDVAATGDFSGPDESAALGIEIMFDLNGNGQFDFRGERFDTTKPFNIAGTTYEVKGLTAIGGTFDIALSSTTVKEIKPPPIVGNIAPTFEAKTVDSLTIKFPGDYKNKLVMLDFWATWCGPCRGEIPNVVKAYEKFHGQGLDVLGISLDEADKEHDLAAFMKENAMPWPQVYDGKGWGAAVAELFAVSGVPHCLLVDGTTGRILAETRSLRGDNLDATIAQHLARRV